MKINEIKITKDKQFVSFIPDENYSGRAAIKFCQNGYQSTVVDLPLHQYDMLKEILNKLEIVKFYEELRNENNIER